MSIRRATQADIARIMYIEENSFIRAIQEEKATFLERLGSFGEGFLLLEDGGEAVGYLCSELWRALPDFAAQGNAALALNHSPAKSHAADGTILYISSFALLPKRRGRGEGKAFFADSIQRIIHAVDKSRSAKITLLALLVNSEWHAARCIYESAGFQSVATIAQFFERADGGLSDGIFMTKHI